MKKLILLMFALVAIFGATAVIAEPTAPKYTCVMHPEVMMDTPGECPKCGMTLVPMKAEEQASSAEAATAARRPTPTERKKKSAHDEHDIVSHEAEKLKAENRQESHDMREHEMTMASSLNITDPMSRESSGSSWVPDSTPMYGRMFMFGDDMLMLHGGIFPRYVNANTRRGDDRIDAPNWFMGMYSHPLGENAQLGFRGMMSLDPLTEGGRGYPLLFQTGETWDGKALHDRQHPHDLFDEISVSYSQKVSKGFSAYLFVGYPGEPALGPPAFMHRLSAMDNPDAPLSHHWQDSTHVTFGVVTLGLVWRDFKIEGSTFKGREPDEARYDFDSPKLDSFSGRLSWNPTKDLAFQVSHGYLHSPEELEPDANRHRTTASLIYNRALGPDTNWSTSLVWGQNRDGGNGKTQSVLVETNYQRGRNTVYARFEHVEKPGHELVLDPIDEGRVFPINAYTLGYVRDLSHGGGVDVGLGGQVTINDVPGDLDRYYGDQIPVSFQVFFRVRPSLMATHEKATNE
jgi:Heavy metal binding domain